MTEPAEREFRVVQRGEIRSLILDYFAAGLRNRTNPETGVAFTEDEIARAIAPGSRWYRQAQADDDYCQGEQRRAIWLSDQVQVDRASSEWLDRFHGELWDPDGKLPATGGSGYVTVTGPVGVTVIGSTTVPDESAYWGRGPGGARFQVFTGGPIGADGTVDVVVTAMDTGADTNLESGDEIVWSNKHSNMAPTAPVVDDFTGGTDEETNAERAARIQQEIRYKQGGGNPPQQRAWTRRASNAIEDAFVYPIAQHAGSTLICITQKRLNAGGPLARIPNAAVLAAAIARMVPPASPVNSALPVCLVVVPQYQTSNMAIHLALAAGSASGFLDATPFPTHEEDAVLPPRVTGVSGQIVTILCANDAELPGGATTLSDDDAPELLWWNDEDSEFVALTVAQIEDVGSNSYEVTITGTIPSWLGIGTYVSPGFANPDIVAEQLVEYFDERGPGEVVATTDVRWHRCRRHPETSEEYPHRVGSEVGTRIIEALGGISVDSTAPYISRTEPDIPDDVSEGPFLLALGHVGIYPR